MEDVKNYVWVHGSKIYFFAGFETETINYLIRLIEKNSERKNLTVVVKSFGGSLDELRAVIDIIKKYNVRVHIVGYAMSAGFYLWCAAPIRTMEKNAKLMYHEVSYGAHRRNLKDHEIDVELTKKEQEWLDQLVVDTGGFTMEELQAIKDSRKSDYYMFYDEAVERGLLSDAEDTNKKGLSMSTVEVE